VWDILPFRFGGLFSLGRGGGGGGGGVGSRKKGGPKRFSFHSCVPNYVHSVCKTPLICGHIHVFNGVW